MLGSVTASGSSRGRDEYLRSPGEPSVCSTSCLSPPVARYSKPWPANIRPASAPTRSTTADAWFPPRERAETLPTLWVRGNAGVVGQQHAAVGVLGGRQAAMGGGKTRNPAGQPVRGEESGARSLLHAARLAAVDNGSRCTSVSGWG